VKAVTLHQPWASAIIAGVKRWENRSWIPRELRTESIVWLGIHAGKGTDIAADLDLLREEWPGMPEGDWPRGLLGFARFDGAGHISSFPDAQADPWAIGPNVWHISQVLRLDQPIPMKGAQGVWTMDEQVRIPLSLAKLSVPEHFQDVTGDLQAGPKGRTTAAVIARARWIRELRGMTIEEVESQLRFRHFLFWRGRCLQSIERLGAVPPPARRARWTEYDIEVLADIYDVPATWVFLGPHPEPRRSR